MTIGETANGRSIERVEQPLAAEAPAREHERHARSRSTVLSGTAIAGHRERQLKAWIAAGVVIESHTAPMPCSNVR